VTSVLSATFVGILLSLAGVMYPAIVAARMQPVEAMRVEE
jgi:ABC-type antimicrobial peptide transport system permease subunit